MGNSKAIGGIAIGIAIVAIIAVYALNQDQPSISNEIPNETVQDSLDISDLATITENNLDYEVNEEGKKKYTITAKDAPVIEE